MFSIRRIPASVVGFLQCILRVVLHSELIKTLMEHASTVASRALTRTLSMYACNPHTACEH